jgi:hypothetical protein
MNEEQWELLKAKLANVNESADNKQTSKFELDKLGRVLERLYSFSSECEECGQKLLEAEGQVVNLNENLNNLENIDYKEYRKVLDNAVQHLQQQHKLIINGYYMSIYMSIGMSLGLVFGLTIFDNIGLGLPIGMAIGMAIGTGLDADAKKKGKTI